MADLIHASNYWPRIFPYKGDVADAEIDRAQEITPDVTQNRVKREEIGREGAVGYSKGVPTIAYTLRANESGAFEFWQKLTNKADSVTSITLSDFKTPAFDIVGYQEDDEGTFLGTVHYPMLRTAGFSMNIGDPDAAIERNFNLVGEKAHIWVNDNKYFVYNRHEAGSGSDDEIDLSAKAPIEDPDNTGVYFVRVLRVRGTATTELVSGTDYTYSDITKVLTITSIQTSDVIKSYYTSSIAPDNMWTDNDSDPAAILADSVKIYLYIPASGKPASSDYIYRLQNLATDVSLERNDIKELGNRNVVKRGVNDFTVNFTLGRILESYTIEQVLRGVSSTYGKIDVEKFTDQAIIIVKIYSDYTKTTFKYGFKATGLSSDSLRGGPSVNAYVGKDNVLTGENLTITNSEAVLGI